MPDKDPMTSSNRTFRNGTYPVLGWILIVLNLGLFIGVAVGQPITPRWGILIVAILFGAPAWFLYRALIRSRVEADATGITVINPLRTVFIPWEQVDHIDADMRLLVFRKNGTRVRAWAVQAANAARMFKRRSFADDVARDLNLMLVASNGGDTRDALTTHPTTPDKLKKLQYQSFIIAGLFLATIILRLLVR